MSDSQQSMTLGAFLLARMEQLGFKIYQDVAKQTGKEVDRFAMGCLVNGRNQSFNSRFSRQRIAEVLQLKLDELTDATTTRIVNPDSICTTPFLPGPGNWEVRAAVLTEKRPRPYNSIQNTQHEGAMPQCVLEAVITAKCTDTKLVAELCKLATTLSFPLSSATVVSIIKDAKRSKEPQLPDDSI